MTKQIRPTPMSRRRFLAAGGAGAGALLLGACGGGRESANGGACDAPATPGDLSLIQFFGGPVLVAGRPSRAPFGVADADGLLPLSATPARLSVVILDAACTPVGSPLTVERHAAGLPKAYFPLRFSVPEPGVYTARAEFDRGVGEMAMQVDAAGAVKVIQPGAPLPGLATPTERNAEGVDPICTSDPRCPLHAVSVAEALGAGAPIALLVSTPAFCQVTICGPVLDVLLSQVAAHPGVQFIHAEVYAHPGSDPDLADYAPTVDALGLHFEPSLVLAGSNGQVSERLDNIFDETELAAALAQLR